MKIRKLTTLTMLLSISIILNIIEPVIPIPAMGVKLGLANILSILALYMYGSKEFIMINFLRVFMSHLLRGSLFSVGFFLSSSGVLLSTLVLLLVFPYKKFSVFGISMVSATMHSIGQLGMVCFIYQSIYIMNYLPIMLILSMISGIMLGVIIKRVLRILRVDYE
ncbi:MAG: Gx transporter family protein [Erysipelotrichaceae bacterium]